MVAEVRAARTESSLWGSIENCLSPQYIKPFKVLLRTSNSQLGYPRWSFWYYYYVSSSVISFAIFIKGSRLTNQDIYCRLDDLGAEVGFEPTISYLMPQARTTKLLYSVIYKSCVLTITLITGVTCTDHVFSPMVMPPGIEPGISTLKGWRVRQFHYGTIYAD